jgi:predicted nucleotidyltransferase
MISRDDNEIFRALQRHGVCFVIVGGHAVNFHGYTRMTEDVDIVWMRSEDAESNLLAALTEIEAQYIGKEIDPATKIERMYPISLSFIRSMHLMMLVTRFGFLDIFDYVPGLPAEDVTELLRTSIEFSGLKYVSLEWLRKMKEKAGRAKDREDIENLNK